MNNQPIKNGPFLDFFAAVWIYSIIPFLFISDLWTFLYHKVYFTLRESPQISRKEYFVFNKEGKKNLNLIEQITEFYKEYSTAYINWADSVAKQTETFSCAIKHKTTPRGQSHQENFWDREKYNSREPISGETPLIVEEGKTVKRSLSFLKELIADIAIFSMAIPIFWADIIINLHQLIYFRIKKIPTLKRSEYVVMDRGRLKSLNFFQKVSCVYCEYANGILPWVKAVIEQTLNYKPQG